MPALFLKLMDEGRGQANGAEQVRRNRRDQLLVIKLSCRFKRHS